MCQCVCVAYESCNYSVVAQVESHLSVCSCTLRVGLGLCTCARVCVCSYVSVRACVYPHVCLCVCVYLGANTMDSHVGDIVTADENEWKLKL